MSANEQLELPYKEITEVANRATVRSNSVHGRNTVWVWFENLELRDGFNIRREYHEIPEFATYIQFNGVPSPLVIDMLPNGDTCPIEQGHRRYKALQHLRDTIGKDAFEMLDLPGIRNGRIECFVNDSNIDELTRLKRQYSSNNGERYTTLEKAELCGRMKVYFNLNSGQIAEALGMSRQQIDNFLILAGQSDQTKQAITDHLITPTVAVQLVRTLGDAEKVTEKVQEAVSSGNKITGSDVKRLQGEDAEGNSTGKQDDDSGERFDESREEIMLCQNVIKNTDKVSTIVAKIPNEQTKDDIEKILGYIQKDMVEIRAWIQKHKKR